MTSDWNSLSENWFVQNLLKNNVADTNKLKEVGCRILNELVRMRRRAYA